jgi:ribosomal protein S18 acetylase RimI-like enzyme
MSLPPNHRVNLRPASTDDIEFMVQLFLLLALQRNPTGEGVNREAIVQGTMAATREQVQGKLKDSTTYVIEFDGQRVGRLRVVRNAEQIEIAGIQVLPDYQGRGIGTAVITSLKHEGMTKALPVVLQVEKDNPDAKRLYLRLGFEQYGETPDTLRMSVRNSRQRERPTGARSRFTEAVFVPAVRRS